MIIKRKWVCVVIIFFICIGLNIYATPPSPPAKSVGFKFDNQNSKLNLSFPIKILISSDDKTETGKIILTPIAWNNNKTLKFNTVIIGPKELNYSFDSQNKKQRKATSRFEKQLQVMIKVSQPQHFRIKVDVYRNNALSKELIIYVEANKKNNLLC